MTELAQVPDILLHGKLMLWSALTLAFFAFLHSSDFTLPSTSHFNALLHLSHNISDGSSSLNLKSSKPHPFCQGCFLLIALKGHSVCAVCAIKKYMVFHPFNSRVAHLTLVGSSITCGVCCCHPYYHVPIYRVCCCHHKICQGAPNNLSPCSVRSGSDVYAT